MQAILGVTFPFFALVLAGYLAARRHVLPESAIPGLNAFVLYFALPCMLFRFGNSTPVLELLNPGAFAVWLVAALLIVFVAVAFSLNARVRLKDAAFGALVAAFPNTGFMGLPLLAALMGPAATAPMVTTMLVDLFVTSSLCIALAEAATATTSARDHGAGARAALSRALRGAVSNPLPWAIALGALGSAVGFKLTGPLEVVVRLLADAATPVALFTIGAVLYRAGQHVHGRTAPADFVPVALVKLFLHPLLVFALATAARSLGMPLSGLQVVVLTLTAALPSASNVSLLAERFGADNGRIARIIMTSTVLAFVSFTTLAWVFGVQPG
ncbi:MAG: AEC family transporter [Burkholderiales bacterium]|nr:AEC family transporter [Burkholderiales bacterium]